MRMGAIFARGSCRALKWTAMLGVVFALGAGSAFAQQQLTPDNTFDDDGVKIEGLGKTIGESTGVAVKVTLRATVPGGADEDAEPTPVTVTVAVVAPDGESPTNDMSDDADDGDIILNPQDGVVTVNFPPNKGAAPKKDTQWATVFLQTSNDRDAEREDFAVTITVDGNGFDNLAPSGTAADDVEAGLRIESTITDDEDQTYVLTVSTEAGDRKENSTITGTVTASPAHEQMAVPLRLHLDDPGYTLDNDTNAGFMIGNDDVGTGGNALAVPSHTFEITTPKNDKNRDEDTVTLSLYSGTAGSSTLEGSEALKVADANALPAVTATAIVLDKDGDAVDPQPDMVESIEEGQEIDLKITVVDKDGKATPAKEKLSVMLMATGDANDQDYDLSMRPVVIEKGDESATIQLTASANPDLGMERLMLDAVVSGDAEIGPKPRTSEGVLDVAIMDITERQVEALKDTELMPIIYGAIDEGDGDDDKFNPGEKIELDASTLFKPTEYNIVYSVDSDMMDVAKPRRTGSMVTVEALMEGGPAQITITATATGPSGAMSLDQTKPNVAQVSFPVTVVDTPLVVKVSTDPMDMVEEGGMVKVTATSTRDILAGEEVVVMLDVNGPATGPDSITIPAGMSYGSIDLTVNDDEMVAPMGDIVITATGPGIDGATVLTVIVTEDDMETTYSVAPAAVSVTEGGEGMTITATASQAVLAATEVMLMHGAGSASAGDYGLDPTSITIEAGGTSGTTMVTATEDTDVEGTETVTLNAMVGTMSVGMVEVTIEDNDMETTYSVAPAAVSVTEGGEGMTITATASRAVLANTEVMLMHGAGSASADDYGLVPVMITIMAGDTEGSTMLTATDDTDVEGMEAVTLNAMIGTMSVGMVEVTIEDDDMPTTYELAPATGMVDEGGEAAVITATASQAVMEDTMVSLTATGGTASADDYSVDAITITAGETSGSTMLMANDDYDVEGMETLTLQGSIGAMIIGSVMFEIGDNDMEITVELSSEDMNIVEGDMDAANGTKAAAMLTATASSAVQVDTTVTIMRDGSSSAVMADFTAAPITITAGETVGTTMVMAVEDDMMEDMEMLTLYGEVDGMNTNMVSFYIWDAAVPALPLIAQLLLAMFLAIGGYRRYLRR